jgi:hypothetical protein
VVLRHWRVHTGRRADQQIGLSPDVYVEPTIAGIREGRDELMEAAVQYILDKK